MQFSADSTNGSATTYHYGVPAIPPWIAAQIGDSPSFVEDDVNQWKPPNNQMWRLPNLSSHHHQLIPVSSIQLE